MKINGIAVSDIDRQSQYYTIHNLCLYYKNKALAEPRYIHGEFIPCTRVSEIGHVNTALTILKLFCMGKCMGPKALVLRNKALHFRK